MTESDDALRVAREEIKRQAAEIAHWKNNHATEVRRARVLKERTDMPLERVRAYEQIGELRAEIEQLQHWKRAVDDACAASWVAATDDARETVKALIARECQIALDPLVSSDAQALMDRGKEEAAAEIERLKTRLEVSPDHDCDGIYCRDATIKLQDEHIAKLQAKYDCNTAIMHARTDAMNKHAAHAAAPRNDAGADQKEDDHLNAASVDLTHRSEAAFCAAATFFIRPLATTRSSAVSRLFISADAHSQNTAATIGA